MQRLAEPEIRLEDGGNAAPAALAEAVRIVVRTLRGDLDPPGSG